jgi:hypothetical protein
MISAMSEVVSRLDMLGLKCQDVRAPCKGARSSVGYNPTWQLLLQPVAIGAVGKVTILPKPPMERVALATPRAGRPERE